MVVLLCKQRFHAGSDDPDNTPEYNVVYMLLLNEGGEHRKHDRHVHPLERHAARRPYARGR
jgi:hypothetical protein